MYKILFLIAIILLILFIIALMVVGLCIGMAYLMIYFIPAIDLVNALVPAAILTTVFLVMLGSMFKYWVTDSAEKARMLLSDYDYDYEDEDEDEPPTATKPKPDNTKKHWQ